MRRRSFLAMILSFIMFSGLFSACGQRDSRMEEKTESLPTTSMESDSPFLQESIDLAAGDELIWFENGFEWDWHSKKSGASLYFLTVASKYDPILRTSEGMAITDRILEHFRNLISGGKEPGCAGNGLNAQGYNPTLHAIAIAKTIPEIWGRLNTDEQQKLVLLSKAALIGANWCYDDENDFPTGLDQRGNFSKMWNPNYREGGVGAAIAAFYVLGGSDAANQVLTGFNYDSFMHELKQAGFVNITSVFEKTGKEKIEAAVKNTFTYFGYSLDQPFYFVKCLAENTWSKAVKASTDGGEGYILTQKEALPNLRYIGMGAEFDSGDENGVRSSAVYVCEGWINSIINRCTIEQMGDWGTGKEQNEIEARMYIGTTDLLYKLKHGYRDYAKGSVTGFTYEKNIKFTQLSLLKELWEKAINRLDKVPADYTLIAHDGPEQSAEIFEGKAVVDGVMEEAWSNSLVLIIDKVIVNSNPASKPATGEARVMWDEKQLYFFADIKDAKLNKDPTQAAWDCDNLEIFIDEGNERTDKYDDNDIQLRIDIENVITCNNPEFMKKVTSSVKRTSSGYAIEAILPISMSGEKGKIIGFDLMINDDTGSNKSSAATGWTGSGGKYLSSKKFGQLTFAE